MNKFSILIVLSLICFSEAIRNHTCVGDHTAFQCLCLKKFHSADRKAYLKCEEYLVAGAEANDGFVYCCSMREFQKCALTVILKKCHDRGIKYFENQLKDINELCNVITGGFHRCLAHEKGWKE
jgi:hypothetical protein